MNLYNMAFYGTIYQTIPYVNQQVSAVVTIGEHWETLQPLPLPVMDHVPRSYQDDPTAQAVDQVPIAVHVAGLCVRVGECCSDLLINLF